MYIIIVIVSAIIIIMSVIYIVMIIIIVTDFRNKMYPINVLITIIHTILLHMVQYPEEPWIWLYNWL